jgi:hypothetical protein
MSPAKQIAAAAATYDPQPAKNKPLYPKLGSFCQLTFVRQLGSFRQSVHDDAGMSKSSGIKRSHGPKTVCNGPLKPYNFYQSASGQRAREKQVLRG